MKIGINISKLNKLNTKRGIGFYTQYLIESLKKYTKEEILIIDSQEKKFAVDVMHYPYFDFFKASLPIKKDFPTVVTIHDTTPLVFPKHYPPGIKGKINFFKQKFALKKVRAVITDSKSSAKDIEKYLNIPSKKIFPIYLSVRDIFKKNKEIKSLEQIKRKYNLPKEYFIYVGDINWNKNLLNLTEAIIESKNNVCFIGKGFSQSSLDHPELKSFKQFKEKFSSHPNVYVLGFIEDNDLVLLLNGAKGLLLPSFYEGFGLPILEAQACGVPVITSNVSSMPEIAGEGALLINPGSVKHIKEAIELITNNSELRSKLVKKGFSNVEKFSWKKTAEETVKVYEYAIKS